MSNKSKQIEEAHEKTMDLFGAIEIPEGAAVMALLVTPNDKANGFWFGAKLEGSPENVEKALASIFEQEPSLIEVAKNAIDRAKFNQIISTLNN